MSRVSNVGTVIELAKQFVHPVTFVHLDFVAIQVRMHDHLGVISWGGFEWNGVGDYGGVDTVEEGDQVSPFAIRLRLSSLGTTLAAETLSGNFALRPVKLYLGFLNDHGALVDTPELIWSGRTDVADVVAGADGGIVMTCESDLAKFDRASGKFFASSELQATYPDDTFFDYMPKMQDLVLVWTETRGSTVGNNFSGRQAASFFGARGLP